MEGTHLLLEASEEGDLEGVVSLLDQAVDVNSTDGEDELTALQVAAGNGHEDIVRQLLMRGASLDQANIYGWTPLLHAARHGHTICVSLLIQHQADMNAKNKLGSNAIVLAARGGHLKTVKLLIEVGVDLSLSTGIGGSTCEFTPLQAAAHHGHDAVVRHLINRGSDVNYRTPSTGVNALMLAALNGHVSTAQILIESQANPNHTNVNSHTPLAIAAISKKREVKGYLERKTTNKPRYNSADVKLDIIEATKKGNIQRVQEILDEDLAQRDACSPQDGATPLMFAAMTGRQDIALLLVEKGCDINKQDVVSGWTALMQATYHGKKTVAKYLISAGADVMIQAKNGCTAFDMASLIEDVDTELYRLLANKAVQSSMKNASTSDPAAAGKKSRTWSPKQQAKNGVVIPGTNGEEMPKTGLKAWWSRMSNRFRNLKLGRTFNLNTNRLVPLPLGDSAPSPIKGSPQMSSQHQSSSSPTLQPHSASVHPIGTPIPAHRSLLLDDSPDDPISNLSVYETLLMDTKKTASLYTLANYPPHSPIHDATLKPVLPPFLPPPTFQTDRPKMPPTASKKSPASTKTSTRAIKPPMKLLQSYSTQNIASASTSPSASTKFLHSSTNASPSSSTGASALNSSAGASSGKSRGPSSASSSTLTAGSDTLNRSGATESLFTPVSHRMIAVRPAIGDSAYRRALHTSPSSSMSSASVAPRRHSRGKSSSRDSASTLTPSPTPKPQDVPPTTNRLHAGKFLPHPSPNDDELGGILKTLSLERYQPIFEEQEVDMEAFLTLSDVDLRELGISHGEPRRQILTAITELNSGKGRERQQQQQDTMSQYSDTLGSRHSYSAVGVL